MTETVNRYEMHFMNIVTLQNGLLVLNCVNNSSLLLLKSFWVQVNKYKNVLSMIYLCLYIYICLQDKDIFVKCNLLKCSIWNFTLSVFFYFIFCC